MVESILNTIKQMLGILSDDISFDTDIIVAINTAFMVLNQLGVGGENVFEITDASAKWTDFLGADTTKFSGVKSFIYLKTKLAFDPPTVGHHLTAIESQIGELSYRLLVQVPIPPTI